MYTIEDYQVETHVDIDKCDSDKGNDGSVDGFISLNLIGG